MNAQVINSSNQAGCVRCHWQSVGRSLTCITLIALLVIGSVGLSYLHLGIPPAACYACFGAAAMIPSCVWYCPSVTTRANQAMVTVQTVGVVPLPQPVTLRAALQEHLTATQDWEGAVEALLQSGTIVRAGQGENPSCHDRLFVPVGKGSVVLSDQGPDELSDPTQQCQPVAVARQLKRWLGRPTPTSLPEFNAIVAQMRRRFEGEMGPLAIDQIIYDQITDQIRAEGMDPFNPPTLDPLSDFDYLPGFARRVAIGVLLNCVVNGESLSFNRNGDRQLTLHFGAGASNQLMSFDPLKLQVTDQPLVAARALATLDPYQKQALIGVCNAEDFDRRVRELYPDQPRLGQSLDEVATFLRDQFITLYLQHAVGARHPITGEKQNALNLSFSTNWLIGISGGFGMHCCYRAILAAMGQVEALRWGVFDCQRIGNLRHAVRRFCIENQNMFPPESGIQDIIGDAEGQGMSNEATLIALAAILGRPIHFFDLSNTAYYQNENGRILPDQIFNPVGAGSPIYLSLLWMHFDSHTPRSRLC